MQFSPRSIVNAFSLSRIVFGMLFVLCFHRRTDLLYGSIALCVLALGTDVIDGRLARRLGVASIEGRLWDSLGDKSFYVAVIVAFHAQGFLGTLVTWALLVREIALYITRVLFVQNLPRIEKIRPWTNWHGYFMYITIILGLSRMYAELHGRTFAFHGYMQASACAALIFGVASIVHFLRLH